MIPKLHGFRPRFRFGFTLVELIAVIVLIGILAAIAVPQFVSVTNEARKKSAEGALAEVLSRYSTSYGKYLLNNQGVSPVVVTDLMSDADAISGLNDYEISIAGSDTNEVVITVSRVKGALLEGDSVTKNWKIPN